jgi:hypothetical protein
VNGEVGVFAAQKFERIKVTGRWEASLTTCDVKTNHASISVLHDKVSDLTTLCRRAHRGQQRADAKPMTCSARFSNTLGETGQDRFHHLVEPKPLLNVQLRGETNFGVHDPVGSKIKCTFPGNPGEGLRRLHDAHRVSKRFEIVL